MLEKMLTQVRLGKKDLRFKKKLYWVKRTSAKEKRVKNRRERIDRRDEDRKQNCIDWTRESRERQRAELYTIDCRTVQIGELTTEREMKIENGTVQIRRERWKGELYRVQNCIDRDMKIENRTVQIRRESRERQVRELYRFQHCKDQKRVEKIEKRTVLIENCIDRELY